MAHAIAYTGVALILLIWLGNIVCRLVFDLSGLRDAIAIHRPPAHAAGRWIGAFERLILAVGIVADSWEILAAVIALKTIARFKEIEDRNFAEYFLVGSLFSILWTMVIAGGWMAYDHKMGIDLRHHSKKWLGIKSDKD